MPREYVRIERDEKVAYTDGQRKMFVPSKDALRTRLQSLLDEAGGNSRHDCVSRFWMDRARDTATADDMQRAWATEVFQKLNQIWDEMLANLPELKEGEEDIFGGYEE